MRCTCFKEKGTKHWYGYHTAQLTKVAALVLLVPVLVVVVLVVSVVVVVVVVLLVAEVVVAVVNVALVVVVEHVSHMTGQVSLTHSRNESLPLSQLVGITSVPQMSGSGTPSQL